MAWGEKCLGALSQQMSFFALGAAERLTFLVLAFEKKGLIRFLRLYMPVPDA